MTQPVLTGRRVLITGGGSGVGADLARGFATAGAEVVIVGRRLAALQSVASALSGSRAGPAVTTVMTLTADVTDEDSVTGMFASAGACDIVIANAGAADSAPFTRTTVAQWNALIAVNLTGVFLTLREGLRQMSGWGRLIVIASIAGLKGARYVAPYVAAKHGAVGLTRALALEVADRPVTVNALCPGYIDTPMTDQSVASIAAKTGRDPHQVRAMLAAANPQGRLIAPAEVTAAALWLCAPGSEGVNGQAIAITGGEG